MSDDTNTNNEEHQPTQEELDAVMDKGPDKLTLLKQKAALIGLTHSPNIGEDTLEQKIKDFLAKQEAEKNPPPAVAEVTVSPQQGPTPMATAQPAVPAPDPNIPRVTDIPPIGKILKMTTEEIIAYPKHLRKRIIRAKQRHEGLALLRCQVYCNNPEKNDLKGEIFTFQNTYIGTVKKFIPFGEMTENGYHIPKVLVDMLRRRKYQKVSTVKNPDGTERVVRTLAPEFTINILPPLTQAELEKMATRQAAAAAVGFMG